MIYDLIYGMVHVVTNIVQTIGLDIVHFNNGC